MKLKKRKIIIIFSAILLIGIGIFFSASSKKEGINSVTLEKTYSLSDGLRGDSFELSAQVQSAEDILIYPEVSGILEKVFIEEGQDVKEGQIIAQLENVNQRLAVKNAELSLDNARIQLQKMQNNNLLSDSDSVLSRIIDTQDSSIENLKNTYLNTDLRAYPEDYDEDSIAPIISGNYDCGLEGEYILEVYSSSASSGASVRVSGLETGRLSVSTDYSVPLVNCGLEIVFPKSFSKNKTWIVPVPNTRSAQYVSAQKNYESAESGKDLVVKQSTVSQEDINHQKKIISQLLLSLESAKLALSKTTLKAPFSGLIYEQYTDAGRLVSPLSPILAMNSPDFELVSFVSLEKTKKLELNQEVNIYIDNIKYLGSIKSIVNSLDSNSQSLKVSFRFSETPEGLVSGNLAKVVVYNDQNQLFIERDFVGFGYGGPFVSCSGENIFVEIQDEEELGYWVNSFVDSCDSYLSLPHLMIENYE